MEKFDKQLSVMDKVYSDYLMKKINKSTLESKLASTFSSINIGKPKHYEVSIVENNGKEKFFGLRIFPVISDMETITESIAYEKKPFKEISQMWKNIENWYIEIDSQIFDRTVLTFVPKELTAMSLHEIGHTIYSDKVIERFYRMYRENYIRLKTADKSSLKFLHMLYSIPLSTSCMLRSWVNGKNEINVELFADKIIMKQGYGDYLVSAINKIIIAFGTSSVSTNENEQDELVSTSVNWCNMNVSDLTIRKNKLKDDLFYQTMKSNSHFMKALSIKLLNDLGIGLRENYSGAAVEASIDILCSENFNANYSVQYDLKKMNRYAIAINGAQECANEAIALESMHKVNKLPSQYDIDAISVECDKMTNQHDRIYVLDLIYNKIEEIESFKEQMEINKDLKKRFGAKADMMLEQLELLRNTVLSKKSFGSNYKLFVKYPAGYEG